MPPSVFISYSRKDEVWKDRLVQHLGVLQNQGLLQTWTDRDIGAGDEWFEEIRKAMNAARVAVVLISGSGMPEACSYELPEFSYGNGSARWVRGWNSYENPGNS